MWTTVRYIMLTAMRDRLFAGLLAGVVVAAMVCAFLGSTAFIETREMTLTLTSGAVRLIVMIGMMVFVCFQLRMAFDNKEIDAILARPVSRSALVLSWWLGFAVVGMVLCVPVLLLLAMTGVGSWVGFFGWSASLMMEMMLVVALALFAGFTLRSAVTAVLGCMGIYILARMMAFFVMTAQSATIGGSPVEIFKYPLIAISAIVPRLDMFTQSQWLLYGFESSGEWWRIVVQALVFVPLLLCAAIVDFRRREF
jgi:hypothetical protein